MLVVSNVLALMALIALTAWVLGGFLGRVFGGFLALSSLWAIVVGGLRVGLWPVLYLALGVGLWLFGHWHFAVKHHVWKTELAQRCFAVPALRRLDPTRRWTCPEPARR